MLKQKSDGYCFANDAARRPSQRQATVTVSDEAPSDGRFLVSDPSVVFVPSVGVGRSGGFVPSVDAVWVSGTTRLTR